MSRIYFHSEHDESEVCGSERAYMAMIVGSIAGSVIVNPEENRAWKDMEWGRYRDRHFDISLNTSIVLGGDAVRLMARLHGQCEIHCYVEGGDREWLAALIEGARAERMFRKDAGWEGVTRLLRSRFDCPVVCSFSICEQFPNDSCLPKSHPIHSIKGDDERDDAFWKMDNASRWNACMEWLRDQSGLQLKPDNWGDVRFGNGETVIDWIDSIRKGAP